MKVIGFEDVRDAGIDPAECVRWVEEALRLKAGAVLPAKTSMKPGVRGGVRYRDVFFNCMPCLIPQIERGGVKLVTRYPERRPALDSEILLYDMADGTCLALMDGDWITNMRTGAVAALSARLYGKTSFSKVGFIGLGNTARATLLCLDADQDRPLEIGLLAYKDQHDDFRRRFEGHADLSFRVFESAEELCSWADVTFSCVTAADEDICGADAFKPGALVVPVHTRGFTQCDLAFDKVFCDDEAHVSGFGYYAQFKSKLAEMADVLEGRATGRDDDSQRIIAYNIGISLHDIYYASKVYDLVSAECAEARLEKPTDKFWA